MWYDCIMRKHEGFTIIEAILVLAVAGLIFAMVFMALPALWASQRDTARREDVLSFIRNLKSFQTNNSRGALPDAEKLADHERTIEVMGKEAIEKRQSDNDTKKKADELTWAGFYRDYFDDEYRDPNGEPYNWIVMWCNTDDTGASGGAKAGSDCTNSKGGKYSLEALHDKKFEENGYYLRIVISATCDGEKAVYSANSRRAAALYRLEGSGVYCEDI